MEENNKTIFGRSIGRKYIELHGIMGKFELPNKSVKVRYFSTIASGGDKRSDSYALLKELKPMRERVKASSIKDLSSLLQRNLDDFRVAYELVPYLLKNPPEIAFFPAVMGVLIPNRFLNQQTNASYPQRTESTTKDGNLILSYDDKWKVELFKMGNEVSNLGVLQIDLNDIEIVVLDGQHRANAFRVISGAFSEIDSSVYPAFYKDAVPVEDLKADLPITLVWFENDKPEFSPKFVSRRLFVDVNNSAKKVSQSRKILLNDYEVASLLTRFFYSAIAEKKSFEVGDFSLFHSEFDKDSDIRVSSNNQMSITNPEFIHEVFSWLTLGTRKFNELGYYRSRDIFKESVTIFTKILDSDQFNENDIDPFGEALNTRIVTVKDPLKNNVFEDAYNRKLHNVIYDVFNGFNFFRNHFSACKTIEDWYNDGMNTYQRLVWEEVFCGGEGLYYTFKNSDIDNGNATLKSYLIAIDEIEKRLKSERASLFPGITESKINSAFDSASTKAFQVGLFMALDVYRESTPIVDSYQEYLNRLNKISPISWTIIFNEIREVLINGTDPKQWPAYQKLILRVIQNDNKFYSNSNFLDSPDGQIFRNNLISQFNSWWENQGDTGVSDLELSLIGKETISKWTKEKKQFVDSLFQKIEVPPIQFKDGELEVIATKIIETEIRKINPI